MEMYNLIITSISSVGFPIVMTLLLLKTMNENNIRHDNEMNELKKSLDNNTLALTKLVDQLGDE